MKIKLKLFKLAINYLNLIILSINRFIFYKNISDRRKIVLFKNVIEAWDSVLDLGANIGFYTVLFSKLVGENGKVFAFLNQDPKHCNYGGGNIKRTDNVIVEKGGER